MMTPLYLPSFKSRRKKFISVTPKDPEIVSSHSAQWLISKSKYFKKSHSVISTIFMAPPRFKGRKIDPKSPREKCQSYIIKRTRGLGYRVKPSLENTVCKWLVFKLKFKKPSIPPILGSLLIWYFVFQSSKCICQSKNQHIYLIHRISKKT